MVTVAVAIQTFILAATADGLSESTIKWYRSLLTGWSETSRARPLDEITVNDLRMYVVSVRERDVSHETLRGYIRCLRRFWSWCVDEYAIANPMDRIREPRQHQHSPKAIALDDLRRVLQAIDRSKAAGKRDFALLCFLVDTGARASGVVALRRDQIEVNEHRAIVSEKGDKARLLRFSRFTAGALQEWLQVAPENAVNIFCSLEQGREGMELRYTGLYQILKRLKAKVGITGRFNPHAFRHGFAREYLRNGGDVSTLQKLLGHADPGFTLRTYGVFTEEEAAKQHDRFSPMRAVRDIVGEGDSKDR